MFLCTLRSLGTDQRHGDGGSVRSDVWKGAATVQQRRLIPRTVQAAEREDCETDRGPGEAHRPGTGRCGCCRADPDSGGCVCQVRLPAICVCLCDCVPYHNNDVPLLAPVASRCSNLTYHRHRFYRRYLHHRLHLHRSFRPWRTMCISSRSTICPRW